MNVLQTLGNEQKSDFGRLWVKKYSTNESNLEFMKLIIDVTFKTDYPTLTYNTHFVCMMNS